MVTELMKKENDCPHCPFNDGHEAPNACGMKCWWTMKRQEADELELVAFWEVV